MRNSTEEVESVPPAPRDLARVIVSVGFGREDFDLVADAADSDGMKLSEFVREAAVSAASKKRPQLQVIEASGFNTMTGFAANITRGERRVTTISRNDRAIAAASH